MELHSELNAQPVDRKSPESIVLAGTQAYQYWTADGSALIVNVLTQHNPSVSIIGHSVTLEEKLNISWTTKADGPVAACRWAHRFEFRIEGLTPYQLYDIHVKTA